MRFSLWRAQLRRPHAQTHLADGVFRNACSIDPRALQRSCPLAAEIATLPAGQLPLVGYAGLPEKRFF